MSAALLTQLGKVLGCQERLNHQGFNRSSDSSPDAKIDGFPARCWYTGPLGPVAPRAPRDQTGSTHMDREARELARRGQADIIRYCQMIERARRQA